MISVINALCVKKTLGKFNMLKKSVINTRLIFVIFIVFMYWFIASISLQTKIENIGQISAHQITEEHSVKLLNEYQYLGFDSAKAKLKAFNSDPLATVDKELIAVHGIIALMSGEYANAFDFMLLLHSARS
jgi:hypothetical protein